MLYILYQPHHLIHLLWCHSSTFHIRIWAGSIHGRCAGASGPASARWPSPIISSLQLQWRLFIFRAKHCCLFYFTTFKRARPRLVSYREKRAFSSSEQWAGLWWARSRWLERAHPNAHMVPPVKCWCSDAFDEGYNQTGSTVFASRAGRCFEISYAIFVYVAGFLLSSQFCFACETRTWWQLHVSVLQLNEGLWRLNSLW